MKSKPRKRRKNVYQYYEIQHTAVTLNSNYIYMPALRLDELLPSLPEQSFMQAYCAWQQQNDTGDVFLFFRTRWAHQRQGIHIHRYLETPPASVYSPIVFAMTHEKEMQDFDERLGYDVTWDQILEIGWKAFCELITQMITESLKGLLEKPKVAGDDIVTYSGDVWWIPEPYRKTIQRVGTTYTSNDWESRIHYKRNVEGLKTKDKRNNT